jgi:hypothetical protein
MPHLYCVYYRHTYSHPSSQSRGEHFIRQRPQMPGIILEFHYVVRIIVAPHEMRLRAAFHAPDMFNGQFHRWLRDKSQDEIGDKSNSGV